MGNWWADRLAGQGGAQRPALPPPAPPRIPVAAPPPVQPQRQLPGSARQDDRCPTCGSANYMSAPGSTYMRCFDCGHPHVQSGSGVGSTTPEGPVRKATQVETPGYNPGVIVGKVE